MRNALMEIEAKAKLERQTRKKWEKINEEVTAEGTAENIVQASSTTEVEAPINAPANAESLKAESKNEEVAQVTETIVEDKAAETVSVKEAELEKEEVEEKLDTAKEIENVNEKGRKGSQRACRGSGRKGGSIKRNEEVVEKLEELLRKKKLR